LGIGHHIVTREHKSKRIVAVTGSGQLKSRLTEKVKAPIGYANAADVTRGHDDKYKNRKKIADMRLRFSKMPFAFPYLCTSFRDDIVLTPRSDSGNPKISNLHESPHDYWVLSW
jgi:hypothetical protein